MDFVVDEWGNCWDREDAERRFPVMAHPELEGAKANCPACGKFVWRSRTDKGFEWRCGCGEVFEGLHH